MLDVLLFFDTNTIPANAQSVNTTYNAIGVVSPVFTVSSVDSVVPLTSLSFFLLFKFLKIINDHRFKVGSINSHRTFKL